MLVATFERVAFLAPHSCKFVAMHLHRHFSRREMLSECGIVFVPKKYISTSGQVYYFNSLPLSSSTKIRGNFRNFDTSFGSFSRETIYIVSRNCKKNNNNNEISELWMVFLFARVGWVKIYSKNTKISKEFGSSFKITRTNTEILWHESRLSRSWICKAEHLAVGGIFRVTYF